MTASELWQFDSAFDQARRERLTSFRDFEEVSYFVRSSISSIELHAARGRNSHLQPCIQPVYLLTVTDDAFDAFFNSPMGYRSRFLADSTTGLCANLNFVASLIDNLLGVAESKRIPELEAINLRTSLLATSGKAWICEEDFPFAAPTKDLAIASWIRAAAKGEKKAIWGLCAPANGRIEIKGALLDPYGNELVPRPKIFRHYELQSFGFS